MFCSLWRLSVELILKLECKLSRLLLLQLAVFFISFKFHVDQLQKFSLSVMFLPLNNPVNNQQYLGEIGMFHSKPLVIKCYCNFLDLQMCYSDRSFDFESLLIVLDLLASFHFEPLAYYVFIIL